MSRLVFPDEPSRLSVQAIDVAVHRADVVAVSLFCGLPRPTRARPIGARRDAPSFLCAFQNAACLECPKQFGFAGDFADARKGTGGIAPKHQQVAIAPCQSGKFLKGKDVKGQSDKRTRPQKTSSHHSSYPPFFTRHEIYPSHSGTGRPQRQTAMPRPAMPNSSADQAGKPYAVAKSPSVHAMMPATMA